MTLSRVAPQTRTVEFPRSKEEWLSVLRAVSIRPYKWQESIASKLLTMHSPVEDMCPIHCECLLIQYLETTNNSQWDDIPPFTYIGVSKLSCSACYLWIQAFNELGGHRFHTRGSHGKWCWPWGVAEVGGVEERLVTKVYHEYYAHLRERAQVRSVSDSSGPDLSQGAQPCPSPDGEESFQSKKRARTKRSGSLAGMYEEVSVPPAKRRGRSEGVESQRGFRGGQCLGDGVPGRNV